MPACITSCGLNRRCSLGIVTGPFNPPPTLLRRSLSVPPVQKWCMAEITHIACDTNTTGYLVPLALSSELWTASGRDISFKQRRRVLTTLSNQSPSDARRELAFSFKDIRYAFSVNEFHARRAYCCRAMCGGRFCRSSLLRPAHSLPQYSERTCKTITHANWGGMHARLCHVS